MKSRTLTLAAVAVVAFSSILAWLNQAAPWPGAWRENFPVPVGLRGSVSISLGGDPVRTMANSLTDEGLEHAARMLVDGNEGPIIHIRLEADKPLKKEKSYEEFGLANETHGWFRTVHFFRNPNRYAAEVTKARLGWLDASDTFHTFAEVSFDPSINVRPEDRLVINWTVWVVRDVDARLTVEGLAYLVRRFSGWTSDTIEWGLAVSDSDYIARNATHAVSGASAIFNVTFAFTEDFTVKRVGISWTNTSTDLFAGLETRLPFRAGGELKLTWNVTFTRVAG